MRKCRDCGADISHRRREAFYCEACADKRKRNPRKYKTGVYVEGGGIRHIKRQDGVCNICGGPIMHYLKGGHSCFYCRQGVLQCSDAMCEGALGDPANTDGWGDLRRA